MNGTFHQFWNAFEACLKVKLFLHNSKSDQQLELRYVAFLRFVFYARVMLNID